MTSYNFTSSVKQEDTESADPNGGGPPPINWATRPIPRSLPTTPRKPERDFSAYPPTTPRSGMGFVETEEPGDSVDHPTIANLNLATNSNDPFCASLLPAEAPELESGTRGCQCASGQDRTKVPLTHPKYHFVTASTSQPRQKYYVVFAGKCVGIFTFWPYVKSLTRDLKHFATFQGFDTFELAAENYNKARSIGVLNIRRVPGDDLQYGPESEGMQDAISL